jgi:hypothetical protein
MINNGIIAALLSGLNPKDIGTHSIRKGALWPDRGTIRQGGAQPRKLDARGHCPPSAATISFSAASWLFSTRTTSNLPR